jgi:hypothetical protein
MQQRHRTRVRPTHAAAALDSTAQTDVEFITKVAANTEVKYTLSSKALSSKGASPWTCSANGTLCKAVVPITIQTLGSRVFVPDGRTKMTIFATTSIFDGKANRMMQVRLAAAGDGGWGLLWLEFGPGACWDLFAIYLLPYLTWLDAVADLKSNPVMQSPLQARISSFFVVDNKG